MPLMTTLETVPVSVIELTLYHLCPWKMWKLKHLHEYLGNPLRLQLDHYAPGVIILKHPAFLWMIWTYQGCPAHHYHWCLLHLTHLASQNGTGWHKHLKLYVHTAPCRFTTPSSIIPCHHRPLIHVRVVLNPCLATCLAWKMKALTGPSLTLYPPIQPIGWCLRPPPLQDLQDPGLRHHIPSLHPAAPNRVSPILLAFIHKTTRIPVLQRSVWLISFEASWESHVAAVAKVHENWIDSQVRAGVVGPSSLEGQRSHLVVDEMSAHWETHLVLQSLWSEFFSRNCVSFFEWKKNWKVQNNQALAPFFNGNWKTQVETTGVSARSRSFGRESCRYRRQHVIRRSLGRCQRAFRTSSPVEPPKKNSRKIAAIFFPTSFIEERAQIRCQLNWTFLRQSDAFSCSAIVLVGFFW